MRNWHIEETGAVFSEGANRRNFHNGTLNYVEIKLSVCIDQVTIKLQRSLSCINLFKKKILLLIGLDKYSGNKWKLETTDILDMHP